MIFTDKADAGGGDGKQANQSAFRKSTMWFVYESSAASRLDWNGIGIRVTHIYADILALFYAQLTELYKRVGVSYKK